MRVGWHEDDLVRSEPGSLARVAAAAQRRSAFAFAFAKMAVHGGREQSLVVTKGLPEEDACWDVNPKMLLHMWTWAVDMWN